jgi:hypothetical protein
MDIRITYHGIKRSPHFIGSFLSRTEYLRVMNSVAENPAAMRGAIAQEAAI